MQFIENGGAGCTFNFYPSDTETLFLKNKKKQSKDWFWHNGPEITYKINSDGFRMNKDFKDVNFDNYFLSIGCSFAFGIGMPYEELYTNLIAKEVDADPVLLANGGHGMDTFFHNFFVWTEKFSNNLPRFVILAHTSLDRKTYYNRDGICVPQIAGRIKKERSKSYKEYLIHERTFSIDYKLKHTAIKKYCELANIPLIEFAAFHDVSEKIGLDYIQFLEENDKLPLGRDWAWPGVHPGFDYQRRVYNYVLEKLNNG